MIINKYCKNQTQVEFDWAICQSKTLYSQEMEIFNTKIESIEKILRFDDLYTMSSMTHES